MESTKPYPIVGARGTIMKYGDCVGLDPEENTLFLLKGYNSLSDEALNRMTVGRYTITNRDGNHVPVKLEMNPQDGLSAMCF